MSDTTFRLATVSRDGRAPFVLMETGGGNYALDPLYTAWRQGRRGDALVGVSSVQHLLHDWDRNFDLLMATVEKEDFPLAENVQRGFHAGAQTHITFGRNEPALQHFHRQVTDAVRAD